MIFHRTANAALLTKGNKGEYKWLPAVTTDSTSSVEQLVGGGATIAHGKKVLCTGEQGGERNSGKRVRRGVRELKDGTVHSAGMEER